MSNPWQEVLARRSDRTVLRGSEVDLCGAIRRGADLRIYTEFKHNEHIDRSSDSAELIQEVAEFHGTYLIEDRWTAGLMLQRQPVALPDGFGPRASMSFFMYNQDGEQAVARPFLDGGPVTAEPGRSPLRPHGDPKFQQHDSWDAGTNAPSHNFIWDFKIYRFLVRDDWREVLSHDAKGKLRSGSVDDLGDAFAAGLEVKVAIRGLCDDLDEHPSRAMEHEAFIQTGSCYYYTEQKLLVAATHPLVRVRAAIPMQYASRTWDFGWLLPRTDGRLPQLLYDPYTLKSHRRETRHAIRWFVR